MGSWSLWLSDYVYGHKYYSKFHYQHDNVSKILISTIGKSELENFYIYPRRRAYFEISSTSFDKLGVLYSSGNTSRIICVQPIGIMTFTYLTMKCAALDKNILHTFNNLNSIPTLWILKNFKNMDIGYRTKAFHVVAAPLISNPFNRTGKLSIYQHLLQIIFSKANASLHFFPSPTNSGIYKPRISTLTLGRIKLTRSRYRNSVPLKFDGYQFLTCHSESFVSFRFYVIPFQSVVWGSLMGTIVILVVTVHLYQKYYEVSFGNSFSPWLFVLANIFEEAGHIPRITEHKTFFRLVLGGWILMSVVLTNCYNGLMISYLNSPLPKSKIPEKFQDLLCDEEDARIFKDYEERKNISIWFNNAKNQIRQTSMYATFPLKATPCFKIFSAVSNNNGYMFLELLDQTWTSLLFANYDSSHVSVEIVTILLLGDPKHIMTPRGHYLSAFFAPTEDLLSQIMLSTQEEISKCEKSVLVIEASDSAAEIEYLTKKFTQVDFYKSKDTLRLAPFGWSFEGEGESRIPKYFQSIVESGIQARLDYEKQMR
ncbi:hypothetical protein Fcan01_27855 [Folsomia candida]|uniref:Uncharacterized protein n=1 Tax=Folsomia candida TaxID=158441 RepID=A0A226CX76_FOLCA|nr:hypothetical protein Fcan01_27855 [Folsomia candida]